jgi:NTP pyrophosphatase (non-canonical NTP hydrolase)
MRLRPEVEKFAQWMEAQLRKNDHKPGWKHELAADLFPRIREETDELAAALARGPGSGNPFGPYDEDARRRIAEEAADIANFCMMIVDVTRGLRLNPKGATRG